MQKWCSVRNHAERLLVKARLLAGGFARIFVVGNFLVLAIVKIMRHRTMDAGLSAGNGSWRTRQGYASQRNFQLSPPRGLIRCPVGFRELLPGSRAGTPVLGRTDRPPFGPGDIVTTETERSSGGHTVARQDAGATVEYNFASLRKVEEKL